MADTDYASLIRTEANAAIMRDEIASGIEQAQNDASNAVNTAENANNTANNTNSRVDEIIAHGTDGSLEELVDIRNRGDGTSATSAGDRVRELGSQLAEKTKDYIFNQIFLNLFKAKLPLTTTGILNLVCLGDSITQGAVSSDYGWKSWVGRLRQLLQLKLGDAGFGFETVWNYATLGTGWSLTEAGTNLSQAIGMASASGVLTIPFTGTSIDLIYSTNTDGGTANVTIDGVSKSGINCGGTQSYHNKITYTGFKQGNHVVTIQAVGKTYIEGLVVYANSTGILVHQVGHAGKQASEYYNHADYINASINAFNPALTIIALGVNDYFNQTPLATYQAAMQQLIDNAKLTGDVLILAYNIDNSTLTIPYSEYYNIMVNLAKQNNCAFVDIYTKWHKSATWATNAGLMTDPTNVHPGDNGHMDIGMTTNEAIDIDFMSGVIKYFQGVLEFNPAANLLIDKGINAMSYLIAHDNLGVQDANNAWLSYFDTLGNIYAKAGVKCDAYVYGKNNVGTNDGVNWKAYFDAQGNAYTTGYMQAMTDIFSARKNGVFDGTNWQGWFENDGTINLKARGTVPTGKAGSIFFDGTNLRFSADGITFKTINVT